MADARGVPLPPAYLGQNYQFPVASIQNPYCERLENMHNKGGVLSLRNGHELFASVSTAAPFALNIASYNNSKLFALVDNDVGLRWYDISNGTPTNVHDMALGGDDEIQTLEYNDYLMYFGEVALRPDLNGPQYYNGSTWGALTYTWPSSFRPFGGCVHKNRALFIDRSTPDYGYSGVDLVSGTVTRKPMAGLVRAGARLRSICSLTISGRKVDNIAVFIYSSGEILGYEGTYPDSNTWRTVGRLRIGAPIYYNSHVEAKGDYFILTNSEILSLRNLFTAGYAEERRNGIGATIKPRWTQIVRTVKATGLQYTLAVKGIYDDIEDRLIINLPFYVDPVTGAADQTKCFQLIYDFTLGAWYEYFSTISPAGWVASAAFHNGVPYVFLGDIVNDVVKVCSLETGEDYVDGDLDGSGTYPIAYKWRSAPAPLSKFGVVQTLGLELIMKTDIYDTVNVKLIGDLGAQETASQSVNGNGSNMSNVLADVGIDANVVQFEISGESASSSVGLEIHATNMLVAPSDRLAR